MNAGISKTFSDLLSPGTYLRAKREEKGLSVTEVAAALRLSDKQLIALENDDYQHMHGDTYVTGYLRNYANLLKIEIDDAIAAHKGTLLDKHPGIKKSGGRFVGGNKIYKKPLFVFYFASLFIIASSVIWYFQEPISVPVKASSAGNILATKIILSNENQADLLYAKTAGILPKPNFYAKNSLSWFDPATTAVRYPPLRNQQDTELPITIDIETHATLPHNLITVTGVLKSWVEVSDDTGAQLLYHVVDQGQRLVLHGKAPFGVYVSNSDAIEVEYLGSPVPFESAGNLFARFVVGAR